MPFIRAACQGSDVSAGKGRSRAQLFAMFMAWKGKGKGKGKDSGKSSKLVDEGEHSPPEEKGKRLQRLRKLTSEEAKPKSIFKKSPSLLAIEAEAERSSEPVDAPPVRKKKKGNDAEETPVETKKTKKLKNVKVEAEGEGDAEPEKPKKKKREKNVEDIEDANQKPVKKKKKPSPKKVQEEVVEEPVHEEPEEEAQEEPEEEAQDEEAEEDAAEEEEAPEPQRKKMVAVVEGQPLVRLRTKTSSDSLGECVTPVNKKVTFSPETKSSTDSESTLLGSSVSIFRVLV